MPCLTSVWMYVIHCIWSCFRKSRTCVMPGWKVSKMVLNHVSVVMRNNRLYTAKRIKDERTDGSGRGCRPRHFLGQMMAFTLLHARELQTASVNKYPEFHLLSPKFNFSSWITSIFFQTYFWRASLWQFFQNARYERNRGFIKICVRQVVNIHIARAQFSRVLFWDASGYFVNFIPDTRTRCA